MGDPAGVGPEVCLHALNHPEICGECTPVVFGDAAILARVATATGQALNALTVKRVEDLVDLVHPAVVDLGDGSGDTVVPGTISDQTGRASFLYINAAIDAALAGRVAAVTTAPINKEALHRAGVRYPGHTEIFADRAGSKRWCMMQYSDEITCTFVTVHVGYSEVPALLTEARILEVIELSAEGLQRIRGRKARVVVCGLNPHAGEHGLFGNREEERIILPAIEQARARGIQVEGPLPPDTAFLPAKRRTTDVFVCMYHDQGHIPVKALAFDTAVNTTLGLPIIRTSVDHGTALDIAWQGRANPSSLFSAIRLAIRLAGT
ncbi:MAG: 4-hydroxythreonine-4-phosphate dehydrogenase PdxA [Verrucomicrobia bacterium]|nr:4-hydroxythreonine-4-phosphate dehydrogenase PdxA [Verrucomicrobiota bacterium]